MTQTMKRPCKKCGGEVVRSPMNKKVLICGGCWHQVPNCDCPALNTEEPKP